jgi:glycogen(starch) synthase
VNAGTPQSAILELIRKEGLENSEADKVKVVYYPVYITEKDSFLGMDYRNFLISADMGIFLSKYEPWGYTPMEAGASMNAAVTTVHSGFGKKLLELGVSEGFFVADDRKSVQKILQNFTELDKAQRLELQEKASDFVRKNFIWKKSVKNYLSAYMLAQERFSCRSERKS